MTINRNQFFKHLGGYIAALFAIKPVAKALAAVEPVKLVPAARWTPIHLGTCRQNIRIVDVTTHDLRGPWRKMIPTLMNGGQMSFDVTFDPADSPLGTRKARAAATGPINYLP